MVNIDVHPLLPAAPFRTWLQVNLIRSGKTLVGFCEAIGLDPRNVGRLMTGEQPTVHVNVVDRALCRTGGHLVDLYPELYPDCDTNLFGELYEVAA